MAEIRSYSFLRHLRAEPNQQVLRYRRGRLVASGRGLAFWFTPLNTSISVVPVDDRELAFLFRGRSRDFQDAVVQGVVSYRVTDAQLLAERVDFTIDPANGTPRDKPLERIAGMVTELGQQFAMEYLVHTDLEAILRDGVGAVRSRIESGLREDEGLAGMGISIVSVRVGSVRPEAEIEKALQVKIREAIQQQADEATFQRRALAVEKERAIQENELQNRIELARREERLIAQRGDNERRRVTDENDAARIAAEGAAGRSAIEADAEAGRIRAVEEARVASERERMAIYRDFPADRLMGLAARRLAGSLKRIDHLNVSPDMLGPMLAGLLSAGTERLEQSGGS
jgi:regulator of protease activity HflC (stomatin/prohibitin superfamily)